MVEDLKNVLRDPALAARAGLRGDRLAASRRRREARRIASLSDTTSVLSGAPESLPLYDEVLGETVQSDSTHVELPEINGIETLPHAVIAELAGQVVIAEVTHGRLETPYIPTAAFKQGVHAAMHWLLSEQEPVALAEEFSGNPADLVLARAAVLTEFTSRLNENRGPSHG